jgi:opacity protein-like surface antigen
MKKTIVILSCIVLASLAVSARGQVEPSAFSHQPRITAGGFGSMFQPDYAGNGIAQAGPQGLFGIGAYVDVRINRWVQVESEGRWSRFNQYYPTSAEGINEDNYLIGAKVPIRTFGRATPYGKFLVGLGSASFLSGHSTVFAYGGGLDYKLSKRFTLRAFDFEYQQWQLTPTLYPFGGSIGLGYRVF